MPTTMEQRVRVCATALWEKEGSPPGRDQEFWERAKLIEDAADAPAMTTPLQRRSAAESEVDVAMDETFPASDPPAFGDPSQVGSKDGASTDKV